MSLDERSDALDKRLEEHPAEEAIRVLVKDAKRRKRQLRILTVSVILDILLTFGLATVSYQTSQIARLAESNKNAVVANCEVSNDSRRNNKALWDYLLALPPSETQTPAEAQQVNQFKSFVAKTFAERNCQAEISNS